MVLASHGLHHRISELVGTRPPPPFTVAFSVTGLCNSRCVLCNVWACGTRQPELETWEWEKLIAQIGPHVKFYTYTGGEPFLRDDLPQLLALPFKYGRPSYLTLSTNCLDPERIREHLETFFRMRKRNGHGTVVYCNLSVDGIGEQHDDLRGVKGNFSKVLQTIEYLKEIRSKRDELRIGIHTVVSRLNVNNIQTIYNYFMPLPYVDSMACEIAEERRELLNMGTGIGPSSNDFQEAILALTNMLLDDRKLDETVKTLRVMYYGFVERWLATGQQPLPCFAARASCQITPEGQVVSCGVRWREQGLIGDLREHNYDFMKIWHSTQAASVRRSIRKLECSCPASHAYYASLASNPRASLITFLRRLPAKSYLRNTRRTT